MIEELKLDLEVITDFKYDIHGQSFKYRDNTKLKGKNVSLPYTKQHVDEIIKCSENIEYFLEHYYKIVHQDAGLITIKLKDYQQEVIQSFVKNRFNICMMSRQSGKTTSVVGYILHFILFNQHKKVAILANKAAQAKEIFSRLQLAYENLPYWLQQGMITWNKGSMELENGCKVIISATSGDAIRGQSIGLLFIDEVAAIPPNIWNDFYEAVYPTVSSSREARIILVATPKGMNHWYKLWMEAKTGKSKYVPILKTYKDIPQYNNQEFIEETIANMGKRKFEQEYLCSFLASSSSLVDASTIENIPIRNRLLKHGLSDKLTKIIEENINIYIDKKDNHEYIIGVDPAKLSTESSGDSLAFQILDITTCPYDQVASFKINTGIHYLQIPEILYIIGTYFNNATIFIENNDQVGLSICDSLLYDFEYENVYSEKAGTNGFRTTTKTKRIGCLNLKMLIEKTKLNLCCFDTISELSTFIKKGNSYEADKGCSDDLLMALLHSLVFLQDDQYRDAKQELMDPRVILEEEEEEPLDMFSPIDDIDIEVQNFWN